MFGENGAIFFRGSLDVECLREQLGKFDGEEARSGGRACGGEVNGGGECFVDGEVTGAKEDLTQVWSGKIGGWEQDTNKEMRVRRRLAHRCDQNLLDVELLWFASRLLLWQ